MAAEAACEVWFAAHQLMLHGTVRVECAAHSSTDLASTALATIGTIACYDQGWPQ